MILYVSDLPEQVRDRFKTQLKFLQSKFNMYSIPDAIGDQLATSLYNAYLEYGNIDFDIVMNNAIDNMNLVCINTHTINRRQSSMMKVVILRIIEEYKAIEKKVGAANESN